MPSLARTVLAIAFLATLAGCASGPKKIINPPKASIQELAVQPDGRWQLTVRLQNFSNVSTAYSALDAKLYVGGEDAGQVQLSPGITVGPESADVVSATLSPSLGAKLIVATALASKQPATYTSPAPSAPASRRAPGPSPMTAPSAPPPGCRA